jgi:hypothetical protein
MRCILTSVTLLAFAAAMPAARAADKPVCALITVQEASAILGVPARTGPALAPIMCVFSPVSGQGQVMAVVPPANPNGGTELKDLLRVDRMDRSHPPAELVSGVGNQAAFFYSTSGDVTLTAFTKDRAVQIVVQHGSGPTTPARKAAMVDTVKKMIAGL